jgi:hypothetical protein
MNPNDDEVTLLLGSHTKDFAIRLAGHHHRLDFAVGADGVWNRRLQPLATVFLHGRDILAHAGRELRQPLVRIGWKLDDVDLASLRVMR